MALFWGTDTELPIDAFSLEGMGAQTEHFSGAELAGLVRSAASFALARAVESDGDGTVNFSDLQKALAEVRPALGTQDDVLKLRYPYGISGFSSSVKRIMRDLDRFTAPVASTSPQLHSMLLVGGGQGAGTTALASWAAARASLNGWSDYVRFVTALDILSAEGGGGDEARASALVERFSEAREMQHPLLVLDDLDQICAGNGKDGYSTIMVSVLHFELLAHLPITQNNVLLHDSLKHQVSTLRALLRLPPPDVNISKAGGQAKSMTGRKKSMHIIAATSRPDAACMVLNEIFDETIVVPLLSDPTSVQTLMTDSLGTVNDAEVMSSMIIEQLNTVGCKTALRLVERAIFTSDMHKNSHVAALEAILEDFAGDDAMSSRVCAV